MSSNKEDHTSPEASAGQAVEAAARRWSAIRIVFLAAVIGLLPFGAWLIGSGIVLVTPPVYYGSAMVRIAPPASGSDLHEACELLRSDEVVEMAAKSLAGGQTHAPDPMLEYLLWSSLSVSGKEGSNLVKLEARSREPGEARRIVMAVAEAYEKKIRESSPEVALPTALVYVTPTEAEPARVPDETRMMLGIAGFASMCLLLCVPLLRYMEGAMPLSLKLPGFFTSAAGTARAA